MKSQLGRKVVTKNGVKTIDELRRPELQKVVYSLMRTLYGREVK
jgi:hypothetical protein